jgi:structure-specific endonuclease subunit SLX1
MKELSMRLHGAETATKLLKRERKNKATMENRKLSKNGKKATKADDDVLDDDYEDLDEDWMNAVNVDFTPEPSDHIYIMSTGRVEIVIEDSEEENFD